MVITRKKAIELFLALGYATVKKWEKARLLKNLRTLNKMVDEDTTTEDAELDKLLDKLLKAGKTIRLVKESVKKSNETEKPVVKKTKKKKAGRKKVSTTKKTTKKKAAAKKKTTEKKAETKKKKTTISATSKVGVVQTIIDSITKKARTRQEILEFLLKKYPDRPASGMMSTIYNQVPKGLINQRGYLVKEDKNKRFKITGKKKNK